MMRLEDVLSGEDYEFLEDWKVELDNYTLTKGFNDQIRKIRQAYVDFLKLSQKDDRISSEDIGLAREQLDFLDREMNILINSETNNKIVLAQRDYLINYFESIIAEIGFGEKVGYEFIRF